MLLGDEVGDVGRQRVVRVLVPVIAPGVDRGEASRLQHLGDEHRLAVADRGRPPGVSGRIPVAFLDRLVERMDAGVVPRLVAVDQRASTPRFLADVQGGPAAVDHERPPGIEGQGCLAPIGQLALDDHAALVLDEAGAGERGPGLPGNHERILMRLR